MIAKRIDAGKDSQGNRRQHRCNDLGNYIRDASHEGEKCLMAWHEGCLAPDYDLALMEIEATQALNTRCKSDKTYHLVVSFRPEDEARLTPEAFQRIENVMAEALGLEEHQRLCGVHKNTNNLHLHVAYNLIHPDTLTMATGLYYDFHKLSKACRIVEAEFGLEVDNGIEASNPLEPKISQHAASMEAHSGEQSFQSFVLSQRKDILEQVQASTNWQEVRQALAERDIGLQSKANGLVLTNLQGRGSIKASAVDKTMSRMRMETRFGAFTEPKGGGAAEPAAFDIARGQTFASFVQECKPHILGAVETAQDWQGVRQALAAHGIAIRQRAGGLVFADLAGKETIKASAVGKSLSKKHMEARFGQCTEPELSSPGFDSERKEPAASADRVPLESSGRANAGESAFRSSVLQHRENILAKMENAKDWQDVHQALADYGIAIRQKGNGLILADLAGRETMKASELDRGMSKKYLEDRFGPFAGPGASSLAGQAEAERSDADASAKKTYQKNPRQPRSPERDQLYKEYQAALAKKIARIDGEKARSAASHGWLKEKWQKMKADLYATTYSHRTRAVRMRMMLNLHRKDVAQEKADHKAAMAEIKADYPWYNWNGYLQHQASQGNIVALGVLRSMEERKAAQDAIKNPAREKTFLEVQFAEREAAKEAGAKWDSREKRWYAPKGSDLDRFTVWLPAQSVADPGRDAGVKSENTANAAPAQDTPKEKKTPGERLAFLAWQERERIKAGSAQKSFFSGCSFRIDNRGVAIITLVSGGTIRDSGKNLHFSPDEDSRQAARLYAMAKFGKHFTEKDNSMEMRGNGKWRLLKPHLGILKECARYGLRTLSQLPVVRGRRKSEVLLQGHAPDDLER